MKKNQAYSTKGGLTEIKSRAGFTIVEVLVAMVLLLGATLGSISFFALGSKDAVDAKKDEYALELADIKFEQYRAMSDIRFIATAPHSEIDAFERYGTLFSRHFHASIPAGLPAGERYLVMTTTVNWTADGQEKRVQLRSIVFPRTR